MTSKTPIPTKDSSTSDTPPHKSGYMSMMMHRLSMATSYLINITSLTSFNQSVWTPIHSTMLACADSIFPQQPRINHWMAHILTLATLASCFVLIMQFSLAASLLYFANQLCESDQEKSSNFDRLAMQLGLWLFVISPLSFLLPPPIPFALNTCLNMAQPLVVLMITISLFKTQLSLWKKNKDSDHHTLLNDLLPQTRLIPWIHWSLLILVKMINTCLASPLAITSPLTISFAATRLLQVIQTVIDFYKEEAYLKPAIVNFTQAKSLFEVCKMTFNISPAKAIASQVASTFSPFSMFGSQPNSDTHRKPQKAETLDG